MLNLLSHSGAPNFFLITKHTACYIVDFNNYRIDKDGMDVSISLPEISSDSKDLEYKLNKEFEKEGKEAYKKYEAEVAKL